MLCYVMLCYVMFCYVTLRYVMVCYVMLCYVMLFHDLCVVFFEDIIEIRLLKPNKNNGLQKIKVSNFLLFAPCNVI